MARSAATRRKAEPLTGTEVVRLGRPQAAALYCCRDLTVADFRRCLDDDLRSLYWREQDRQRGLAWIANAPPPTDDGFWHLLEEAEEHERQGRGRADHYVRAALREWPERHGIPAPDGWKAAALRALVLIDLRQTEGRWVQKLSDKYQARWKSRHPHHERGLIEAVRAGMLDPPWVGAAIRQLFADCLAVGPASAPLRARAERILEQVKSAFGTVGKGGVPQRSPNERERRRVQQKGDERIARRILDRYKAKDGFAFTTPARKARAAHKAIAEVRARAKVSPAAFRRAICSFRKKVAARETARAQADYSSQKVFGSIPSRRSAARSVPPGTSRPSP